MFTVDVIVIKGHKQRKMKSVVPLDDTENIIYPTPMTFETEDLANQHANAWRELGFEAEVKVN